MHVVIAKTNAKEVKHSAHPVLYNTIMYPFNRSSVEAKRFTIENMKDKEMVKTVKGRQRIQMLGKYVSDLNSDTGKAMADIE